MREVVYKLTALGPMPSSQTRDVSRIREYEELISSITPPLSDEEAKSLVGLFGPDECFGLAWSLLHLIESSPGWPLEDCLERSGSVWIERLRDRAARAH
jgi:hypothetical protein